MIKFNTDLYDGIINSLETIVKVLQTAIFTGTGTGTITFPLIPTLQAQIILLKKQRAEYLKFIKDYENNITEIVKKIEKE